jgi:MFS family permease
MSRDLILLIFSLVTWGIGEGMFFYFQPIYLEQLGADPILIGIILGAYGVAMTIAHIPAGYLADRIGRKPMMLAAWILGTLSAWMMALANSLPFFVVGMLVYGTTLFVIAPLNSYITTARGKLSVGRAITLVSASFNIGAIVGPLIGGRIGERIGLQSTYQIAAWLFVLSTLILLSVRSQPVEWQGGNESGRRFLFEKRFLAYLFVMFIAMYAMYLPQPLAPNYLETHRGLNLEEIGWLYSISGIGIVSLSLILGQIEARIGFIVSQIAVGAFAFFLLKGTNLPWYAAGYFLLGGYKVARSLAAAQVRFLVRTSEMGLGYGLTETIGSAATVLAPPLAGYLYDRNPQWIFLSAIGLTVVALAINFRFLSSYLGFGKVPILDRVRIEGE